MAGGFNFRVGIPSNGRLPGWTRAGGKLKRGGGAMAPAGPRPTCRTRGVGFELAGKGGEVTVC